MCGQNCDEMPGKNEVVFSHFQVGDGGVVCIDPPSFSCTCVTQPRHLYIHVATCTIP